MCSDSCSFSIYQALKKRPSFSNCVCPSLHRVCEQWREMQSLRLCCTQRGFFKSEILKIGMSSQTCDLKQYPSLWLSSKMREKKSRHIFKADNSCFLIIFYQFCFNRGYLKLVTTKKAVTCQFQRTLIKCIQ